MELKYFSSYPYAREDLKEIEPFDGHEALYDCKMTLNISAVCSSDIHTNPQQFVMDCFESLDMPEYRGYKGKKFYDKEYKISVAKKKHFYGATNWCDGVFVVNRMYFVVNYDGVHSFDSLSNAVFYLRRTHKFQSDLRLYTQGST